MTTRRPIAYRDDLEIEQPDEAALTREIVVEWRRHRLLTQSGIIMRTETHMRRAMRS